MTFRRGARLDSTQVRDVRGRGVPGGGMALAGGGGIVGLVLVVAYVLLGGNPGALLGSGSQVGTQFGPGEGESLAQECQSGEDANARDDCRIVGFVNSLQVYWTDTFTQSQLDYEPAVTYLFSDGIQSGCGFATADVGPFYCPQDVSIYLDLTFFGDMRSRLGAQGGPLAEGYVVAHEYGHHIQDLLGDPRLGPALQRPVGPDRAPGRLLCGRLGRERGRHRLPEPAVARPGRDRSRRGGRGR